MEAAEAGGKRQNLGEWLCAANLMSQNTEPS
jgi:hypothetical protein